MSEASSHATKGGKVKRLSGPTCGECSYCKLCVRTEPMTQAEIEMMVAGA